MANRNRGRLFALAAGVGIGVWFGAVLAAGREDQTRAISEDPNAASSIRIFSNSGQAESLPSKSQGFKGFG